MAYRNSQFPNMSGYQVAANERTRNVAVLQATIF